MKWCKTTRFNLMSKVSPRFWRNLVWSAHFWRWSFSRCLSWFLLLLQCRSRVSSQPFEPIVLEWTAEWQWPCLKAGFFCLFCYFCFLFVAWWLVVRRVDVKIKDDEMVTKEGRKKKKRIKRMMNFKSDHLAISLRIFLRWRHYQNGYSSNKSMTTRPRNHQEASRGRLQRWMMSI